MSAHQSDQWVALGPVASAEEQAGLDALKKLITADPAARGWSNPQFISPSGRVDEVDAFVITRVGAFVIELKGWTGDITGNQSEWVVTSQRTGKSRSERNPYLLASEKSRRLAGLLKDAVKGRGVHGRGAVPFIGALVLMHGKDSTFTLGGAAGRVLSLPHFGVKGLEKAATFFNTAPDHPDRALTPQTIAAFAAVFGKLFSKPPVKYEVGDYDLTGADRLGDGPDWVDYVAENRAMPSLKKRVRVFDVPADASREERARREDQAGREVKLTRELVGHPGIEAPEDYKPSALGPALIFPYNAAAVPLAAYLDHEKAALTVRDRERLVQELAEILAYAHDRHVAHRALTDTSVWVAPGADGGRPRLTVRDWAAGRHESGAEQLTRLSAGTRNVRGEVDQAQWVYLAPETIRAGGDPADSPAGPLDVYGWGTLAYLIMTGRPPAPSLAELSEAFGQGADPCLDPAAAEPGIPEALAQVIREATRMAEARRPLDLHEVASRWEKASKDANRPEDGPSEEPASAVPAVGAVAVDPVDATAGDTLDNRFIVSDRRGAGSTGVALLVDDAGPGPGAETHEGVVLKVARDEAAGGRLAEEAAVLRRLDHRRIVRLVAGPLRVGAGVPGVPAGGRAALLLSDAGARTWASELGEAGRFTLGQLETLGGQLIEAVAYLDSVGVFHRDIKPANLGIAPDPGTHQPSLVLFDFSAAAAPAEDVGVGTDRYRDPSLGARGRYDRAAELWSVAVTLFEAATGDVPEWPGDTALEGPPTQPPNVRPGMFPEPVAGRMADFFMRALAPAVAERFDTAGAMSRAWGRLFGEVTRAESSEADGAARDRAAAAATLDTPLARAGLTARAVSALAGLPGGGVRTVDDLLSTSAVRINATKGLGEADRKETQRRRGEWLERFRTRVPARAARREGPASVETLLEGLVPRGKREGELAEQAAVVAVMFHVPGTREQPSPPAGGVWPTLREVVAATGLSRAVVERCVGAARARWAAARPDSGLRTVARELEDMLGGGEHVATLREAADTLLLRHGSLAGSKPARRALAAGLVRAVLMAGLSEDLACDDPGALAGTSALKPGAG
ncbi:MAG: NERD domain-containing protein, partial [Bifidobacteriaceae bacterium]|nr:NERD domain-containing protein [Bifidobacteriaceae bacterium]